MVLSVLQSCGRFCNVIVRLVILLLLLLPAFGVSAGSEIIGLIKEGKIDEARSEIARAATAVRRDGTLLYFQALLEPDGQKSLQFLEAALKAELSPRFLQDNIYLTALYFLADGNYERLASTTEAYLQHWENSKYRSEALRLAALASHKIGQGGKSDNYLRRLILENPGSQIGFQGELDKAYSLCKKRDYIEAQNICGKLRKTKYDEVVAIALYILSLYSLEQKRIDDAILYYNILKERYPHAIGLDDLVDKFGRFEKRTNDGRAEEITGTTYSVQVGVFSVKKNAGNMANRMKQYGVKVEIKDRIISDKRYHVVYVGRFKSSEEALALKSRLELSEKEAFHVVAR